MSDYTGVRPELIPILKKIHKLSKKQAKLAKQLPEHKFERVYDDKPGVVGTRCRCGLWSGKWYGDNCVGVEVALPEGMRYGK